MKLEFDPYTLSCYAWYMYVIYRISSFIPKKRQPEGMTTGAKLAYWIKFQSALFPFILLYTWLSPQFFVWLMNQTLLKACHTVWSENDYRLWSSFFCLIWLNIGVGFQAGVNALRPKEYVD